MNDEPSIFGLAWVNHRLLSGSYPTTPMLWTHLFHPTHTSSTRALYDIGTSLLSSRVSAPQGGPAETRCHVPRPAENGPVTASPDASQLLPVGLCHQNLHPAVRTSSGLAHFPDTAWTKDGTAPCDVCLPRLASLDFLPGECGYTKLRQAGVKYIP
jgi:hypothetical protein